MLRFNSILLLISSLVILFHSSFSLWKKSKDTLADYVIDILFTNSLTIIRCNPYERHTLRAISIELIGLIKCSNRHVFLPSNHVERITLLQWDYTQITCDKKNKSTLQERTYVDVKHSAKNAFKKHSLEVIRVGSTGPSKFHWKIKQSHSYFEHPTRQLTSNEVEQNNENFTTTIYSFKHRPIICREKRFLSAEGFCSNSVNPEDFSYICYYKIGVAEPPKIAEMEKELKTLPKNLDLDDESQINNYVNKKPKRNSSWTLFHIVILIIAGVVTIVIIIIICCCCCCRSEETRSIGSGTSITSNIS